MYETDIRLYLILGIGSIIWVVWSMASNGRSVLSNLLIGTLWSIGIGILLFAINNAFGWNLNAPDSACYVPDWFFYFINGNIYQGLFRFAFKRY